MVSENKFENDGNVRAHSPGAVQTTQWVKNFNVKVNILSRWLFSLSIFYPMSIMFWTSYRGIGDQIDIVLRMSTGNFLFTFLSC